MISPCQLPTAYNDVYRLLLTAVKSPLHTPRSLRRWPHDVGLSISSLLYDPVLSINSLLSRLKQRQLSQNKFCFTGRTDRIFPPKQQSRNSQHQQQQQQQQQRKLQYKTSNWRCVFEILPRFYFNHLIWDWAVTIIAMPAHMSQLTRVAHVASLTSGMNVMHPITSPREQGQVGHARL